jgi:hypothetical protein
MREKLVRDYIIFSTEKRQCKINALHVVLHVEFIPTAPAF